LKKRGLTKLNGGGARGSGKGGEALEKIGGLQSDEKGKGGRMRQVLGKKSHERGVKKGKRAKKKRKGSLNGAGIEMVGPSI